LPPGERLFIEAAGRSIVIFNLQDFVCHWGCCSHDNGRSGREIEEFEIICPRHGARFDIRTGKATSLPAVVDIPSYPVRVIGDMIEIGLPKG